MILIIGGAYQGKTAYAKKHYPQMALVQDFHETVKGFTLENKDAIAETQALLPSLADKVVIFADIFCGVVPTDNLTRRWREDCGRTMALLAGEATTVIRLFCGIGSALK